MSYRYDIAYIISGAPEDIIAFVAELKLSRDDLTDELAACKLVRKGGTAYIVFSEFGTRCCYHDIWLEARQHEEYLSGRHISLGEEDDDNTVEAFGEDLALDHFVSWSRTLEVGLPSEELLINNLPTVE